MRIVVIGAGGRLGAALARSYQSEHAVIGFNHQQLDLAAHDRLRETLAPFDFDVLINCAAKTNVDECERQPESAFALNRDAPRILAEICAAEGAKLIHISTDYVFDGAKRVPYTEEDAARPISIYGESKREGERGVLEVSDRHLVVRLSWVFGPDRPSFVDWAIQRAREDEHVEAIADKISAPTYTLDVAEMLRPLLDHSFGHGLLHIANRGECSWQQFGQWALDCCRAAGIPLRTDTVRPIALREMRSFIARRPIYTVLATGKLEQLTGIAPRDWRDAVADYVRAHVASKLPRD
jgi:dTDP-4-dehydrorhamnose reductase